MKRLALAFFIPVLFSAPAYSDELCQEEARAMGYVGPLDTLEPCKPKKSDASEGTRAEAPRKDSVQESLTKQDSEPTEQFGQAQTE